MATIEYLHSVKPALRWTPVIREQTLRFKEKKTRELGLTDGELDRVLDEAQTILGRCVPPTEASGTDTGLVVGYVQSGKTMSFTTVLTLARDNGYRLVIFIAGVAVNLKSQSEGRLLSDLGLNSGERLWAHFENPDPKKDYAANIGSLLGQWKKKSVPEHKRRTVLITVLKNHTRLKNLVAVLKRLDLSGVPTLIIDDESDQASLNTKTAANKKSGGSAKSSTYDWVTQLKAAVLHHTFLGYTATPQANLLLHIADVLTPSFAELVTPGKGYVGGKEFFASRHPLVTTIPEKEIPSKDNPVSAPPKSLQSALRYFLLGCAAHYLLEEKGGNRSMMIHPSQKTAPHADYKAWVNLSMDAWQHLLGHGAKSASTNAAVHALFRPEYDNLKVTYPTVPSFDDLLEVLDSVMADCRVLQVNSTAQGERDVRWRENAYWIIVGGQKLDRGFTVEGLTVTYMPRPIGTGNADTLQQRARFFGYKESYKGLCRVFLPVDIATAFKEYVEHEEFVRDALSEFRGRPLMDWKRDFILTRWLSPTRPNVIGRDIEHIKLDRDDWIIPGHLYKDDKAVENNRRLLADLHSRWTGRFKTVDAGDYERFKDKRTKSRRNILVEGIPLRDVFEEFILHVRVADYDDSTLLSAVALSLRNYLAQDTDALCDVFMISELKPETRTLTKTGRPNQVFSGKSPNTDDFEKLNFVGESALHTERATLHLRTYDLRESEDSPTLYGEVPWFTLRLPAAMLRDSVIET